MMSNHDFDNGVLYIGDHKILFSDLIEILDMIKGLEETEIVDVDVNGDDVSCTFANGETQTAHCHPEDYDRWSLETGISVCLGKYLTGGSNEYNRIIRQGVKTFRNKIRAEADKLEAEMEEQRIRENKKRKHERYLKRRAERLAAKCAECNEHEFCEDRKDVNIEPSKEEMELSILSLINDLIRDLGIDIGMVID